VNPMLDPMPEWQLGWLSTDQDEGKPKVQL
jgi:hypothetical protein